MNKLVIILQLILISSTVFAQSNSDPLEQEFNLKKQQYEKALLDLNKRYSEVLGTLHKQVSESKLRPNPELLRKIEAEAAVLNTNLPSQWYLGDWKIVILGKESFGMRFTPQGWQRIAPNGVVTAQMTSYEVNDGVITTTIMKNKAVISKGDTLGQKLRLLYFGTPDNSNTEEWTGVRAK